MNKVEPVYLEHCGTILQRSYVSFLSMSTEEDEDSALKSMSLQYKKYCVVKDKIVRYTCYSVSKTVWTHVHNDVKVTD